MEEHEKPVTQVAWSPNGQILASASDDRLLLWDVKTGRRLLKIEMQVKPGGLAWSPDNRQIKALLIRGCPPDAELTVQAWDACSGRPDGAFPDEKWHLASVAISSDKSLAAVALRDTSLRILDLPRSRCIAQMKSNGQEVYGVALAPDRRTLAVSYQDGSISIRDLKSEQPPGNLKGSVLAVHSIAFGAQGRLFASKAGDGTIVLRCWRTRNPVATLTEPFLPGVIPEICFHPRLPRIAVLEEWGTAVRIWDLDPKTLCVFGEKTMIPVLFMAAAPTSSGMERLRLDEELREIRTRLQAASLRELFGLEIRMAVRPLDLQQALLAEKPTIVQFSGHGTTAGEIVLESDDGQKHAVDPEALAEMFELVSEHVRCVVLNACYSEAQARAIAKWVDYVIGMNAAISDEASIRFSTSFYLALGEGSDFEHAFRVARNAIRLYKIPEHLTPVLIKRRRSRRPGKLSPRRGAAPHAAAAAEG